MRMPFLFHIFISGSLVLAVESVPGPLSSDVIVGHVHGSGSRFGLVSLAKKIVL